MRSVSPRMTSKLSRNLSLSSRCHWNVRFAGATISVRRTSPRALSSLSSNPAMIVLPAPGSSASRSGCGGASGNRRKRPQVGAATGRRGRSKRKVRVVLIRQGKPLCFDAEPEPVRVAIERPAKRRVAELGQLRRREDGIAHQPRLAALADQLDRSPRGTTASTSTGSGNNGPVITEPTWISSTVIGDLLHAREDSTLIPNQSHFRDQAAWKATRRQA